MRILSNDYESSLTRSTRLITGGPAQFAFHFSRTAERMGHEWLGVLPRRSAVTQVRLTSVANTPNRGSRRSYLRLEIADQKYQKLLHARSMQTKRLFDDDIAQLSVKLAALEPDIVFLNGFSLFNWILLSAANQASIPSLVLHVGSFSEEIMTHAQSFSPMGCKILQSMDRNATTLSTKEAFLTTWGWRHRNQHVIRVPASKGSHLPLPYNPIFAQAPAKANRGRRSVAIGVVARWDAIKNHEAILHLAKQAQRNKLPWQFYAITSIPQSSKKRALKKPTKNMCTFLIP